MAQIRKTIKISRYNYIEKEGNNNFGIVDGEIYECFCYEKIVNEHSEILFVNLTENKNDRNGFWISSDNSLYYQSDGIDLGEFDLIGFDKNGVLNWWEITRQKTNYKIVIDKLERKRELLSKLFDKYNFYLVLPEDNKNFQKYKDSFVIIEEPDYVPLRKPEYDLIFNNNNFCELSFLNQKAKKYNYIDDLINVSRKEYKGSDTKFNSYLFERLYDLDNIRSKIFSYYDVEKKKLGKIKVAANSIFKDGKRMENRKATSKEVREIRRRMENCYKLLPPHSPNKSSSVTTK